MTNAIKSHAMYSESDYAYLSGKGYSDDEIIAFWDRDAAMGKGPQLHLPKKGDKVRTVYGEIKTVLSTYGCMVVMDDGSEFHHTKVWKQ